MKTIINPFDNHCIGCSPLNPFGLKMTFSLDEEKNEIVSIWQPNDKFQGYPNVLHGGIQSLMADEIAAWSVYVLLETAGVTKNLNMQFLNPLFLSKGNVSLRSGLISSEKRSAIFEVKLYDGESKLCSEGTAEYFIYPKNIAVKKFDYPGLDAFFSKK